MALLFLVALRVVLVVETQAVVGFCFQLLIPKECDARIPTKDLHPSVPRGPDFRINVSPELTAHRVALVCPSQGIDTSSLNPAGQLQLNILMAIAEFERAIIRERVTAGLRAAKTNGVKLGRPDTLTKHLPAVAEMLRQGLGVRAIARQLNLPVASAAKLVSQARNGASPL